ncbi:hypothetical protein [Micromonospora sp. C28ISP2-4]|uniref:hypothetical protein n=1 Tax=Micromonospora sp. C28ISP2-4 TaxID=3059523 RepID=UPI0026760C86|nr:hypothetical protein [Micromonospora sp. C28ISP2-4]MDO3685598.1 hypothetical protein [Micromonospora sp. C28ISP2-4]
MSEASTDRVADRPAEVTDPLLWDLAAAVADAHQPDAERVCASPSCAGAAWPCAAWNNAQAGLSAARTPRQSAAPRQPATSPQSASPRPVDGGQPGAAQAGAADERGTASARTGVRNLAATAA